ncbi:MAG: hypothetical protein PSV18_07720 [Methylobacter sp.]|nr:hypothetical protein [Candidatus Methylobacter titanis]
MKNKTYHFNIGVDIATQKFDVSFSDQRVAFFENNVVKVQTVVTRNKKSPKPA